MTDTEKITINLSVVDVGRIDLLVDQGFYSTRTDFIRTATRNQLSTHASDIQDTIRSRHIVVGVNHYDAADLEKYQLKNEALDLRTMGLLILDKDISPELARATISSIKVFGSMKASPEVKAALSSRIVK